MRRLVKKLQRGELGMKAFKSSFCDGVVIEFFPVAGLAAKIDGSGASVMVGHDWLPASDHAEAFTL